MGGPMYDSIIRHAGEFPFVSDYLNGSLDQAQFRALVDQNMVQLLSSGLSEWAISLLKRFPVNHSGALEKLRAAFQDSPLSGSDTQEDFDQYREYVLERFSHLEDRFTSIFPEEARAAFELSRLIEPRRVVVAGSYYLFLAVWLVPGLADGGSIVCADPDSTVCALAEENISNLGIADRIQVVCGDAIELLENETDEIDLLVIDAYGSRDHRDPRFHGKAIYGPIARAALPHMSPGATMLVHNADSSSSDLDEFFQAIKSAKAKVFLDTTEHLAVFRL